MRLLVTRRLLPPDAHASAIGALYASPLFAPQRLGAAQGAADACYPAVSMNGGSYLRSLVELCAALHDADLERGSGAEPPSRSHDHGGVGGRRALLRWLGERLPSLAAQHAFESTSPWRCALQLHHTANCRRAGTEHALVTNVFCSVAAGLPAPTAPGPPCAWRASCAHDANASPISPPIPYEWLRR